MKVDRIGFTGGNGPAQPSLELTPTAITIFIGPNNGGKSTALREINMGMFGAGSPKKLVVAETSLAPIPTEEMVRMIDAVVHEESSQQPDHYDFGRRASSQLIHTSTIQQMRLNPHVDHVLNTIRVMVLPHFAMNLDGQTRLSLTNPGSGQKLSSRAMTTVAAVFKDDVTRERISKIVFDAFGMHLVVDATQLGSLSYALSSEKPSVGLERSFTDEAIAFFGKAQPIADASDGTKAFIGVISEVIAGEADVIFIDEPEAFLHPGLSYALGREVAYNVSNGKQLFAATHSPQFLMGCIEAGASVNVVRLSRRSDENFANLLDSQTLSSMMSEPLLRTSNVISGLFYNSVVVVEGNSDRAFYEEINLRLGATSRGIKHPLFINAHGKQTAAEIVRALRNAGVPTAVILDIDWIKEDGANQAKYFDGIGIPTTSRQHVAAARGQTRRGLEGASGNYKRQGGIDLLTGDAKATANDFFDSMEAYGLFTVRRGELEAWLPHLDISRSKQGWLERVFQAMRSSKDEEGYLEAGYDDVWAFLEQVSAWLANPSRKGMLQ